MPPIFREKLSFLLKLRLFWLAVFLLIFLVFLYLKILPFGQAVYERTYPRKFSLGKGFIYDFTPEDRIEKNDHGGVKIIGDPVYFSVFTPRTFDKAKLIITYRNNLKINTPIVEAGVLADKLVWRYNLQPLSHKTLDYLGILWNKVEDNNLWLLQKENNYQTISELEADLRIGKLKKCSKDINKCLAIYNYNPPYKYRLADYQRSLPIVINQELRGPHQFYIYLDDEFLQLDFYFDYLRLSDKPSPIEVILSSDQKIIKSLRLDDDGRQPIGNLDEFLKLSISEKNLVPGPYKIEIKGGDDFIIKKIYSSTGKLSFINKLWLSRQFADNNLEIYTDSSFLQIKLMDPAARQTILFGDQDFLLSEPYIQTDLENQSGGQIKKIILEKSEVVLENNGVFSFSSNSLMNPQLSKIDRFFSVDSAPPYIMAVYQKPKEAEGITTASAEFNLKGVYRENGRYNFMIAVPGLKAEDKIDDNLEIMDVRLEFTGRTLWQKLSDYWQ